MSTRKCTGKTKKGTPCKASPRTDTGLCNAHSPKEVQESSGFGGSQAGAGRPPVPRATEVQRRLVEENILIVQRPYWLTLGYDVELGPDGPYLVKVDGGGAKLYGESKDGYINVSPHDDLGAMQAASEKLQDRAFGRAKQAVEHSGPEGGPVEVVPIAPDTDRAALIASLLKDQGAVE